MALTNLRNALMTGKRTPTAKDYVQSGLVAMWDGIENAGWGVHDASATTWKDLTGNGHDFILNTATFGSDYISISPGSATMANYISGYIGAVEVGLTAARSAQVILLLNRNQCLVWRARYGVQFDIRDSNNCISGKGTADTFSANYSPENGYVASGFANGSPATLSKWTNWTYTDNRRSLSPLNYSPYAFTGGVRFIRMYSRNLTAAEIAANYAIDKARFGLP